MTRYVAENSFFESEEDRRAYEKERVREDRAIVAKLREALKLCPHKICTLRDESDG